MSADRLDQLDYYTLLGVEEGVTADALRDAFHRFALKYHPDRHRRSAPDVLARAGEIYRRGAEAYRVLVDPELRRRYDAMLSRGVLRFDPAEDRASARPGSGGHSMPPPGHEVRASARPFFLKAEHAMKSGDFATAKLNYTLALGYEPGNDVVKAKLRDAEDLLAVRRRRPYTG